MARASVLFRYRQWVVAKKYDNFGRIGQPPAGMTSRVPDTARSLESGRKCLIFSLP
jgi:hypothetical protein